MNAPRATTASPTVRASCAGANSTGGLSPQDAAGDFLSRSNRTTREHAVAVLRADLTRAARKGALDHQGVFEHFAKRVGERMPAGSQPFAVWNHLISAVVADNDPEAARFCCAAKERGRQVWRFSFAGQVNYAVWDIHLALPITILPAGGRVARRGKKRSKTLHGGT